MTKPKDQKKKKKRNKRIQKRAAAEDSKTGRNMPPGIIRVHAGTCSPPGQRLAESVLLRMKACVSPQASA